MTSLLCRSPLLVGAPLLALLLASAPASAKDKQDGPVKRAVPVQQL